MILSLGISTNILKKFKKVKKYFFNYQFFLSTWIRVVWVKHASSLPLWHEFLPLKMCLIYSLYKTLDLKISFTTFVHVHQMKSNIFLKWSKITSGITQNCSKNTFPLISWIEALPSFVSLFPNMEVESGVQMEFSDWHSYKYRVQILKVSLEIIHSYIP